MIDRDLIISRHDFDTMEIHPRGDGCEQRMEQHQFDLTYQVAGFIYKVCGACATVRIKERR